MGALLVVAAVAGLLALRQAERADRASVVADAGRVGAQALLVDDVDHALLLAAEAVHLDDSVDTRSSLLGALSRAPELVASTRSDGAPFQSVEVSPDGRVVAVGQTNSGVSFYDAGTREVLGSYDEMPAMSFEFRPDGEQLAVNGQPDTRTRAGRTPWPPVRLVDTATWKDEPTQLGGIPEDTVVWEQPHYSADGRFLAVTFEPTPGGASDVLVWDVTAPEQPVLRLEHAGRCAALSPDGSVVYVGSGDGRGLTTYDVATGRKLASANVPGCTWLDISPDGSLLAAKDGSEIVILAASTLTELHRLEGHSDDVLVIRFSPSGDLLASGSTDGTAIVWNVATGERRHVLRGSSSWVWGVAFSSDERTLFTTAGRALLTWDLAGERRFISRQPFTQRPQPASGAFVSPSGEAVAYAGGTNELQFVDLATGRAGPFVDTGHGTYGWFTWRPDGGRFATVGHDGFVRVWDWRSGQLITERHVAPMHITGVDYTGDGRRLVVAEQTGTTYAIDAETLEPSGPPVELDQNVVNVYASPDNHTAIVLTDERFSIVDLDDGRVIHDGAADAPHTGEFSPDGRRFALGSASGEVRLLDVETGEWLGPPRVGHGGLVHALTYAPDGAMFVTGADDQAIVLWDADNGTPLNRVLPGADGSMEPSFRPDGGTVLISSSVGEGFYELDLRTERWLEAACAIAGRGEPGDAPLSPRCLLRCAFTRPGWARTAPCHRPRHTETRNSASTSSTGTTLAGQLILMNHPSRWALRDRTRLRTLRFE